jgi:flagellar assembly factor FliW
VRRKVDTKAYGLIEADEQQRIHFPSGVFGFEQLRDYALLDAEQKPFYWLQALDARDTAFILVNPFLFMPDYELDIGDTELAEIGLEDPAKALVFAIVTIPLEGGPVTANLQGPLIVNKETRIGRQLVLNDQRWGTRHSLSGDNGEAA